MVRNFLLALVVLLGLLPSSCYQTSSNYGGPTVYKEGQIMLQGLLPITHGDNSKCDRLDVEGGLIWMAAMIYAVEEINNSGFLKGATLGYKIDNTCRNIPTAMNQAIRIVSKHRPNSVCRPEENVCRGGDRMARRKISAVIGPAISWISIPVASLLGLYSIPQISYASTSRILSDKTRYKSFLRTIPSDEFQAEAMADFMKYFQWNYVYLIASDDDYGKMGAAAFKAEAKKLGVCVPNDEYINFTAENSDQLVHSTMMNVKKAKRAKVLVVFSYLSQGERLLREAERQNITDRTWITSDAWGTRTAKLNISKKLLNGIFSYASAARKIPKFDNFINNLTTASIKGNYWFEKYFSQELGCQVLRNKTGTPISPTHRYCDPWEKLPPGEKFTSITNENSGNVIDAVYAVANGLRDIFTCKWAINASYCPGANVSVDSEKLLESIKNTTFKGIHGTLIEFNKNGEKSVSEYTIRNLQVNSFGEVRYVQIGNWIKSEGTSNFTIKKKLIAWNSGEKPVSTCFRECQPGERVVGQSECCWNCQKCGKGHVSASRGALRCTKCNETDYANEVRTQCLLRRVVYLRHSDPAGVSIIVISCLGLLLTTTIAVVIARIRDTPVVQDSSPFLLCVFFVTLYISFFFSIGHALNTPSDHSCIALNSLFVLLQMLYAIFLLIKTRQVSRWLRSAVSCIRVDMPMVYAQLTSVFILLLLQGLLTIIWQNTAPSEAHYINELDRARLLECVEDFPVLRILATVFPIIVLVVATLLAFRERNLPDNFNEAKFISFSTIALCIVLIAFIPTYRYVGGISKVLVVTFTSFIAAFSCMGCIFIPKLYIIFFRAERNVSVPNQDSSVNCGANSSEVRLAGNHHIHRSTEQLADKDILDENIQSNPTDSSLCVNGLARSRLSLSSFQERFNLAPLHEFELSEDSCEPPPVNGACVEDKDEQETEEERSSVQDVETSENEEVQKHVPETANEEFLV